jgi:uncharacterized protein YdeI (YjbR/CyaY-like superfamily)
MGSRNPAVDAYIENAQPFAQPILRHIRAVVHEACSGVEEEMKWSFPHFNYKGMFCGMAAFKQHATFGFWKHGLLERQLPATDKTAMGQFGRLTSIDDLPGKVALVRLIKAAMKLNDEGVKASSMRPRARKPPVRTPPALMAALRKNRKALATFQAFSPSHRRDYVEWITEARQDDTRARRIETAVAWMAQGKTRNWKYERPSSRR